jgi:hypothetical protein
MTDAIASARHWLDRVFYGTITTAALLFGLEVQDIGSSPAYLVSLIWATGLGLLVAHGMAGVLSHRLTTPGRQPLGLYRSLFGEELPLLIPSGAATLGLIVGSRLSDSRQWWLWSADLALALLAGGIAFRVGTLAKVSVPQRLALSLLIVAIVLAAAVAKLLVGEN